MRTRWGIAGAGALLTLGLVVATGGPAARTATVEGAAGGPAVLELDAPRQVGVGEAIRLVLRVRGAADLAGYEAALVFDPRAAEPGALFQREGDLQKLGRAVEPLGEVPLPGGGLAFGLASCPVDDCVQPRGRPRHPGGGNGTVKLATVSVLARQAGTLELRLAAVKLVDAAGTAVAVDVPQSTVRVRVGRGGPLHAASAASPYTLSAAPSGMAPPPAGPFDLTRDGRVDHGDLMEAVLGWQRARGRGAPCALVADEAALDLNHDGCLDVADAQLLAAHFSQGGSGASAGGAGAAGVDLLTAGGAALNDLFGAPRVLAQPAALGLTFTVDSTADTDDVASGDGVCRTSTNVCTLRAAISEANAHPGPDTIAFNIPGGGVKTIAPASRLPTLSDTTGGTTIDGYTQPGASPNTDPLVSNAQIMANVVGVTGANGFNFLDVTSAGNTIRGLAFSGFAVGINLVGSGAHDNRVVGDFVQVNAAGNYIAGSAQGVGLNTGAGNNRVGDVAPADRNVVNRIYTSSEHTNNNRIYNNLIGLAPHGDRSLGAPGHGVDINSGSSSNLIGGTAAGQRNVSSGHTNGGEGIEVSHDAANANVVAGNYIGVDATGHGTAFSGNSGPGIQLEGPNIQDNDVHDNVIGRNGIAGVHLLDALSAANRVHDNRIGVAADGSAIENQTYGVFLDGEYAGAVQHQVVGPDNVIANNPTGVAVRDDLATNDFNAITRNSIYANVVLGIDLGPLGQVNPNDPGDADGGPNQQLNFPVLTQATTQAVQGTACPGCTVEVFVADRTGSGNHGQGKTFVGSTVSDAAGSFVAAIGGVAVGQYVTATATDPQGDTSEFALNIVVSAGSGLPTPTVGPSATPTPTPVPSGNLVQNPSFEANVSGWYGYHSTLTRVAGGQDGAWAAQVTLNCACTLDTIDDSPNTVANPQQGQVYVATAWVKAGSPSAVGKTVQLYVRESGGASATQESASAAVVLSNAWQEITVTRTVAKADRTSLDLYAAQASGVAAGDAYLVDAISLVHQ